MSNRPEPRVSTLRPEASETGRATVLLVDDAKLGARQVKSLIEAEGHNVLVAHQWSDALKIFTSEPIDLVLMDAVMPNVDGFKLTRIFRERAKSYVPIVFLTALTNQKVRARCVEVGADDLLTKPVDEVELRIRLVAMLRIRRLTKALEEKTEVLTRLAKVDALTGLYNRRTLDEHVPREVARARRYGRPLSLMMIDIDHFKKVNDTHGHEAGDHVLTCLGTVLNEDLRDSDLAYRYGGEEFVVLTPETGPVETARVAERIRAAFANASRSASDAGEQTLSIGIASVSAMAPDSAASTLQAAADAALYEAKRGGRDRVVVASE